MKSLTALLLLGLIVSLQVQAEVSHPGARPLEERAGAAAEAGSRPEPAQRISPPSSSIKPAGPSHYRFQLTGTGCVEDRAFSLTSPASISITNTQWYLKTPAALIHLNKNANGSGKITLSLPPSVQISPLQSYPVYFKADPQAALLETDLEVYFCPPEDASPQRQGEIVLLVETSQQPALMQKLHELGLSRIEITLFIDAYQLLTVAGIKSDQNVQQLIGELKQLFPGLIIDSNDFYFPAARPRLYSRQLLSWPDEKHCADQRGNSIKVGIIDGKMDTDHPALKARSIEVKRFVSEAAEASSHATVIAVILAGSEGELTGLMPGLTLLSAQVIEPSKYGDVASVSAMLKALSWFHQQQVRLVNLSLAGQKANSVLQMALQIASQQGMLVFAAAGNDKQQAQPIYPAAFENVFAITAVDAAERLYANANQADFIDFAAPGVDLWTADSESAGRYRSGTSYAVPHAVAIAAVLLDVNPTLSRELLYESLKRMSKDLGEAGHDARFGWGLLQYPTTLCQ